jgi:hypothetical protein
MPSRQHVQAVYASGFFPVGGFPEHAQRTLSLAAESTGGFALVADSPDALVRTFGRVFEDFRSAYVLVYQPTGVSPRGWHQLNVSVGAAGKFTVHARKGYFGG